MSKPRIKRWRAVGWLCESWEDGHCLRGLGTDAVHAFMDWQRIVEKWRIMRFWAYKGE
jgi:hypothetical protein